MRPGTRWFYETLKILLNLLFISAEHVNIWNQFKLGLQGWNFHMHSWKQDLFPHNPFVRVTLIKPFYASHFLNSSAYQHYILDDCFMSSSSVTSGSWFYPTRSIAHGLSSKV